MPSTKIIRNTLTEGPTVNLVAAYLTAMDSEAFEPPIAIEAMQMRPDKSWNWVKFYWKSFISK